MADGMPKDGAIARARVNHWKRVRHGAVIGSNEATAKKNFMGKDEFARFERGWMGPKSEKSRARMRQTRLLDAHLAKDGNDLLGV